MSDLILTSPATIEDHGLILISGPDAIKFLQGQVTCDIRQLAIQQQQSQTTLGAHCNSKGRMIFSFRACQLAENTIALAVYRELIPQALAALKKYSIFSKVELIDSSGDYQIVGACEPLDESITSLFPELPKAINEAKHTEAGVIIAIAEGQYECWIKRPIHSSTFADGSQQWTFLSICNGIGEVRPETVETFIPQMLNYQAIADGISFKKGCYTGQEVVARMQYLGKLKRRLYRFSSSASELIPPGTSLFSTNNSQSVGNVVISAKHEHRQELLAVVTEEASEADNIYLDTQLAHKLLPLPLPYAITKE